MLVAGYLKLVGFTQYDIAATDTVYWQHFSEAFDNNLLLNKANLQHTWDGELLYESSNYAG